MRTLRGMRPGTSVPCALALATALLAACGGGSEIPAQPSPAASAAPGGAQSGGGAAAPAPAASAPPAAPPAPAPPPSGPWLAWQPESFAAACAGLTPRLDAAPGERVECDPGPNGCGSPFLADAAGDLALTCATADSLFWNAYTAPRSSSGGPGPGPEGDASLAQPGGFAVLATRREPSGASASSTVRFVGGAQIATDSSSALGLSGDFEGGLLLVRRTLATGATTLQHLSQAGEALGPEIPWAADPASSPAAAALDVSGRTLLVRKAGTQLRAQWRAGDLSALGAPFSLGAAGPGTLVLTAAAGGGLLASDAGGFRGFVPSGEARLLPVPAYAASWTPPDPTSVAQFFTVFGGRAWARLECDPRSQGCVQTVRVLAADGTACGRLSLRDPASGAARSVDAAFRSGTVMAAGASAGAGPSCASFRWWPQVLR